MKARSVWVIIGVLCLALFVWAQRVDYTGYQVLRIKLDHPKQCEQIHALVRDIWTCHQQGNTVDVCASPEERRALEKAGFRWTVLIDDVEALIRQQQTDFLPQDGDLFGRYLTLDEVYEAMRQLALQNPRLVQRITVGQSVEGRPIYALRLTKDPRRARVYPNRPQVVINGAQHAREWISVSVTLYLAYALVAGYSTDTRVQRYLDRLEVYLVPVVNPDGYLFSWTTDRLWRKNRRFLGTNAFGQPIYGVDLNRNWGYQWGGVGSSGQRTSQTYRGPAPFSEAETYTLSRWISSLPTLRAHLDMHSYSQLILWPWGFTDELPPFNPVFQRVGQAMQSAIQSVYGLEYVIGPIYTTIYPASGGMTDWVFAAKGALSFSYELRDTGQYGFLLPPDQIRPNAEEVYPAVLELLQWAYERDWRE